MRMCLYLESFLVMYTVAYRQFMTYSIKLCTKYIPTITNKYIAVWLCIIRSTVTLLGIAIYSNNNYLPFVIVVTIVIVMNTDD